MSGSDSVSQDNQEGIGRYPSFVVRTDGSFFPKLSAAFDPIDYKTTWTSPVIIPGIMGAAALVYKDGSLIGQKTISRPEGNPRQAEALSILLGLSAISDAISFRGQKGWRETLIEGLRYYFTRSPAFATKDRPLLALVYAHNSDTDKSTLYEGQISIYDIRKALLEMSLKEEEILIIKNKSDLASFTISSRAQIIISALDDGFSARGSIGHHIFTQIRLPKEKKSIANDFLILNDCKDLVRDIHQTEDSARSTLPLDEKEQALLRGRVFGDDMGDLLSSQKSKYHRDLTIENVLAKYLNQDNLLWERGEESLQHHWARRAALEQLEETYLRPTTQDISSREIALSLESRRIAEEIRDLEESAHYKGWL